MQELKTRGWRNFRLQETATAPEPVEKAESTETASIARNSGTFFDAGAVFEGTLRLTGDFRIDSEFHGELVTDGMITVGRTGSVEGNIEARQVEIEGAVVGNVTARRMLILHSTGRLHGDVETACLEIERRAFFQGSTKMIRPFGNHRSIDEPTQTEAESPASSKASTTYAS